MNKRFIIWSADFITGLLAILKMAHITSLMV